MLIISETARLDLLEIFSHIAEDRIDSAHKVITELAKKFDLLEANRNLDANKTICSSKCVCFRTRIITFITFRLKMA